ncbi:MAG: hypothetical protein WAL71_15260 [Terriglobales bacterium]|jgi:hypothetical protein
MNRRQFAIVVVLLLGMFDISFLAHAQMSEQSRCAHLVAKDIARTKQEAPEVFSTIAHHNFEWSPKYQSCVMVIQYRVHKSGKPPEIQVVATNAATMQPMEGTKNVFLIPATETKEIEDATNFLFEKYSH